MVRIVSLRQHIWKKAAYFASMASIPFPTNWNEDFADIIVPRVWRSFQFQFIITLVSFDVCDISKAGQIP
jgi:hypothetical protein